MELYERDYFVSMICVGYKVVELGGISLHINPPTLEQKHMSNMLYKEAYKEASLSGVFTREEIAKWLSFNGLWGEKQEKELKRIQKDIEDFKVQLFNSFFQSAVRASVRALIEKAQEEQGKLLQNKYVYSTATCEGVAEYYKEHWLIENATTFLDGTPYDWERITVSNIVSVKNTDRLTDSDYRELVRNDPWRSIWASSKKTGTLFEKPATELTEDQKTLIAYSNMYDSITESPECPPEEIISDDYALDGWMIIQRRKREKDTKEKMTKDIMNDKIVDADEVFIKPTSSGDIERINEMNSARGKMIKRQRSEQVKREGSVKQQDLHDVRQDLRMQANQQQIEKIKGG